MLLPECHDLLDGDGSVWTCARSLSFGTFCLATLVVGVIGCQRILPVFLSTRWYFTNLCMLTLSALQMVLLVYECFVQNSSKILVVVKYCRGVQIAMSCMLYGKLACDTMNRSKMVMNVSWSLWGSLLKAHVFLVSVAVLQCAGAGGRGDDAAHDVHGSPSRSLRGNRLPQRVLARHVHDRSHSCRCVIPCHCYCDLYVRCFTLRPTDITFYMLVVVTQRVLRSLDGSYWMRSNPHPSNMYVTDPPQPICRTKLTAMTRTSHMLSENMYPSCPAP